MGAKIMISSNRNRRLLAALLASLLLAACTARAPATSISTSTGISVADELLSYWNQAGAEATLGPPMQPAAEVSGLLYQVFLNVELVYDRRAPSSERISLYPLGLDLGLAEPPVPPPADPAARYFESTGHTLYASFAQTFLDLGGERVAGAPISEVKHRDGRAIQYFENLGLYLEEGAAPSEVRLLALGLAACGARCLPRAQTLTYLLPPDIIERPFASFLDRFGGERLLGAPLTEPYLAPDGSIEQIYQRAVVFSASHDIADLRFRHLGEMLGPSDPPVLPSYERGSSYFPETGHNVAWAFADFYAAMQGELLLGLPMEEAHLEGDMLVQRFQNGILEYHYDLPAELAMQLAPLGELYLTSLPADSISSLATPIQPTSLPQAGPQQQSVTIETQVRYAFLPMGETQEITIRVLHNGIPWPQVTPRIVIHGPRADFSPEIEPTDAEGRASVLVALDDLLPGEIVNYEVLISGEYGQGYAIGQYIACLESWGD
jgi:hypothetical protein